MPAEPKPEDWAMLGVAPGCTKAEARAAYLRRATALHPDHHPDAVGDERVRLDRAMAALNAAWDRIEAWPGWSGGANGDSGARPGRPRQRRPRRPPPTRDEVPPEFVALPMPPPGFVRNRTLRGLTVGDEVVLVGRSADLLTLARTRRGVPYRLLRCERRKLRHEHLAAAIDALPELRHLDLEDSGIGDESVALLARRTRLVEVRLGDTAITDASMPVLAALADLRALHLGFTRVTDEGVARLGGHQRLATLNLRGTRVTMAGLDAVTTSCPSLGMLCLPDLAREERRALEAEHPDIVFV